MHNYTSLDLFKLLNWQFIFLSIKRDFLNNYFTIVKALNLDCNAKAGFEMSEAACCVLAAWIWDVTCIKLFFCK